jgi:hypothetical protein
MNEVAGPRNAVYPALRITRLRQETKSQETKNQETKNQETKNQETKICSSSRVAIALHYSRLSRE